MGLKRTNKHLSLSTKRKKRRLPEQLRKCIENKKRTAASKKENTSNGGSSASATCTPSSAADICGRRIVDIGDVLEQLKTLGNHGPFGCTQNNMVLAREKRAGLRSCFIFECNFCHAKQSVRSEIEKPGVMDVNTSAVCGTVTTGGGHSQLEEMLTTMNIPTMSDKTFRKFETKIGEGLMATAAEEMKKAAEEEAQHAREQGEVDKDGTPLITVVADGSWCKRSYRTNYSSLSGVDAINSTLNEGTSQDALSGSQNHSATETIFVKCKQQPEEMVYEETSQKHSTVLMECKPEPEEMVYEGTSQGAPSGSQNHSIAESLFVECKPEPEEMVYEGMSQGAPSTSQNHSATETMFVQCKAEPEEMVYEGTPQGALPRSQNHSIVLVESQPEPEDATSLDQFGGTKRPGMEDSVEVKVPEKMERDRFDVFAELVADKLRHMHSDAAEHLMSQILHDINTGEYRQRRVGCHCGLTPAV